METEKAGIQKTINSQFPRRVTRSSAVLSIVTFVFFIGFGWSSLAMGFGVGAALSLFSFEVLRIGFETFIKTPEEKQEKSDPFWKKGLIGLLLFLKLPIWIAVLYVTLSSDGYNLIGLLFGIAITQIVMVLKVASRKLVENGEEGNRKHHKVAGNPMSNHTQS